MVKTYTFGLLPPTTGASLIAEQCDLAWRAAVARLRAYEEYRAARTAIELHESPACAESARLETELDTQRATLRQLRAGARKYHDDVLADAARSAIRECAARLKVLAPIRRQERRALQQAGRFVELDAQLKATYLELAHRFTAAGLFWGQRQLVEAAHDQRIKSRTRLRMPIDWCAVGTQLQGGLPVGDHDTTVVTNPRITITEERTAVPTRKGKPLPRLRLRIAPNDGTAEWPIIIHRPLPAGSNIRFVKVASVRIGRQIRWQAHLTLSLPDPVVDTQTAPCVAVRPTFAKQDNGLTAANTIDDADDASAYRLHPAILGGFEKAQSLQAIRDRARDALLKLCTEWKNAGRPLPVCWPRQIAQWESCNRLRDFVLNTWARNRADGDEELFVQAHYWATHDAHLWDWERHAYARASARRLHDYRTWAASLAARYNSVVVPNTDYAKLASRKATPEHEGLSAAGSRQRFVIAPGLLRDCIVQAFLSRGKHVIRVADATPSDMLRERSDGTAELSAKRQAKFAARHKKQEPLAA